MPSIGLLCVPQFAVLQFGSVFLHDVGLLGTAAIAATMATLQISAMVLRIWCGHWTDRHGNRHGYLGACVLISTLLFALLAAASAGHAAGTALGLCNTLVFAANFLTPQAVASLLLHQFWAAAWLAASGLCLLTWPLLARRPPLPSTP